MKPRGFTLVEMLISMVLTLILVYAIAEFYAYVGETVRDGRAQIEVSSQLRGAVQRLKGDIDLRTCPVVPWADDGSGLGYFAIAEGIGKDWDTNGNGIADAGEDLEWGSLFGDVDDLIGFTARNKREPWVGQVPEVDTRATTNQGSLIGLDRTLPVNATNNYPVARPAPSYLAEIVWWTGFSDTDLDGIWTYGDQTIRKLRPVETRRLHRRLLLVRPDLNVIYPEDPPDFTEPYYFRVPAAGAGGPLDYYTLMQYCDVSIRPVARNLGGFDYYAANSLADLARRENRFMHIADNSGVVYPVYVDLNPHKAVHLNPALDPNNSNHPLSRANPANSYSQYRWVLGNPYRTDPDVPDRRGEDVLLSNLLAFDVRVFDPTCPIRSDTPDDDNNRIGDEAITTIQPGDVGWNVAVTNGHPIVGFGAYVDLGYARYCTVFTPQVPANAPPTAPRIPRFAGYDDLRPNYFFQAMHPKSLLASGWTANPVSYIYYDTWAQSYERDGINQDAAKEAADGIVATIDQATDGLDLLQLNPIQPPNPRFIYRNGVDDLDERETAPPFDYPLRGIEVTIRLYEPGTRQVKQSTVGSDFIAE